MHKIDISTQSEEKLYVVSAVGAYSVYPKLAPFLEATVSSAGPILFYDRVTSEKIDTLLAQVKELSRKLDEATSRIEKIEDLRVEPTVVEIREVTRSEAKKHIKNYFATHGEKVLFPSDVAIALLLDYDVVESLMHELETDGQIEKAKSRTSFHGTQKGDRVSGDRIVVRCRKPDHGWVKIRKSAQHHGFQTCAGMDATAVVEQGYKNIRT